MNKTATPTKKRHHSSSSHPLPTIVTPCKRPKTAHSLHPSIVDPYDPPVSAQNSPITHRTSIGPTPQKDGMVLGLFDDLSSGSRTKTPSERNALLSVTDCIQATPSKRLNPDNDDDDHGGSTDKRHHKSPLGASKHSYLNTYITPSTCRVLSCKTTPASRTGVSKLCFEETPKFLRRDSQRMFAGKENAPVYDQIAWSPVTIRTLSKGHTIKGLSTLVKGLRDMENEKLDEDWDLLREMEENDALPNGTQKQKVFVIDSQNPDMPLGLDGGLGSEEIERSTDEAGIDGKPLKIWKKRGQKRTTRRVVMKPNTGRWKPEPAWKGGDVSGEDNLQGVEDSQSVKPQPRYENQSWEDEKLKGEIRAGKAANAIDRPRRNQPGKEGFATTVKKKISATAHANFRALKIKNRHSKGNQNGKYGKTRR